MINIKKYLQFRNTPDGKPRVLMEGVDYDIKTPNFLWNSQNTKQLEHDDGFIDVDFYKPRIALEDCRPLLTVEIEGVTVNSLSILWWKGTDSEEIVLLFFDGLTWKIDTGNKTLEVGIDFLIRTVGLTIPFETDPAKYSKLLWNCTEEEGWERMLKLLNVK
jgi:hypothetical protein